MSLSLELSAVLDRMLSTPSRFPQRQWVGAEEGKVYVRVTTRVINGQTCPTIDVASVEVEREHEGKGVFKSLLAVAEEKAAQHSRVVFVESVLNDVLLQVLPRYGYTEVEGSLPPSFCKTPEPEPIIRPRKKPGG